MSSDSSHNREAVSPCWNNAERNLLSKWMLWPTSGVCWIEFFWMKLLIWLQAFGGWTAWRLCCSISILFSFIASFVEL